MTKKHSKRIRLKKHKVEEEYEDIKDLSELDESMLDELLVAAREEEDERHKNIINNTVYHKGHSEWRHYVVPFYPLSHNNAYSSGSGGKRFLRREYDEYKAGIIKVLLLADNEHSLLKLYGDAYEVEILAIMTRKSMFYEKGSFRKFDVDGMIKLVQDAAFEYLEYDDSNVISVTSRKTCMPTLPWPEKKYSGSPVWDLKGGIFILSIRTVPMSSVNEVTDAISIKLKNAIVSNDYYEPKVNMNRGKKEQQKRLTKDLKKQVNLAKHDKSNPTRTRKSNKPRG